MHQKVERKQWNKEVSTQCVVLAGGVFRERPPWPGDSRPFTPHYILILIIL